MARAVVVQHLEPEGPALIGSALRDAGVDVSVVRPDRGEAVPPDLAGIDGLVVMGGPTSARSDDGFASRPAEIALLTAAIDAGIPTLGVCLGSQLLAAAGSDAPAWLARCQPAQTTVLGRFAALTAGG